MSICANFQGKGNENRKEKGEREGKGEGKGRGREKEERRGMQSHPQKCLGTIMSSTREMPCNPRGGKGGERRKGGGGKG